MDHVITRAAVEQVVAAATAEVIADFAVSGVHVHLVVAISDIDVVDQIGASAIDEVGVVASSAIDLQLGGDVRIDVNGFTTTGAGGSNLAHSVVDGGAAIVQHTDRFRSIPRRGHVRDRVGFVAVRAIVDSDVSSSGGQINHATRRGRST